MQMENEFELQRKDVIKYVSRILASALDVSPFRGIALSNTAHPFNHCRRGLFSGGRAQTSNGIAKEEPGGGWGGGGRRELRGIQSFRVIPPQLKAQMQAG